ncbi:MAG: PorP/SprF family type IX secretion system membrane protein [Flavicella sp.]
MKKLIFIMFCFSLVSIKAQETLKINSDYLSDNVYLLHPAAAGIGNSGKIRITNNSQWRGVKDAPSLQTLSFHNRFGKGSSFGTILFNDENGYHASKGVQMTYAYHINLSKGYKTFRQLSFALSLSAVQQVFDTSILADATDSYLSTINNSDRYFNGDFGVSFHWNQFFSYLTIKNIFLTTNEDDVLDAIDLSKYIVFAGCFLGKDFVIQIEPSLMAIYEPYFERTRFDFNCKFYKTLKKAQVWGAISYSTTSGDPALPSREFITPIFGMNYKQFMCSYAYSQQLGGVGLSSKGGYHQLTLGMNVFVRKSRLSACPNINTSYFY